MQKVIYQKDIHKYKNSIDQSIIDYIEEGQIETYESFDNFDLIAFDWNDLKNEESEPSQILIYIDKEDLVFICENDDSYKRAQECFATSKTNEHAMYLFFKNLFKNSFKYLEEIEDQIEELDDEIAIRIKDDHRERITDLRNKVLDAKSYYEQMEFIFEEICDNDNDLISDDCLKYFENLHNRSIRLLSETQDLREYITQVKEAYQAQIGIEQNNMMKVFTMVTSIFLPLTLVAGWYGMNVKMPEFNWDNGYLFVIIMCVVITIVWLIVFWKKKWFK